MAIATASATESIKRVRKEWDALRTAEKNLESIIKAEFPAGTGVTWSMGGHEQRGVVLSTSRDRLFVENARTEAQYWIGIYDVLDAAVKAGLIAKLFKNL